jgi:tripartite-type tricarboxylate transporter receptor subunit TctC
MKKLKALVAGLVTALAVCGQVLAQPAATQTYPTQPIRFVIPTPPGTLVDQVIRLVTPRLTAAWGQPIVADNRTGAGQSLGVEIAAHAKSDGYTLLIATNAPFTINPVISKVRYDPLTDFEPIVSLGTNALVLLVNPQLPVHSVADLIALAKSKPGALRGGTSGNGSTAHLSLIMLNRLAGLDIMSVPYKGGPASLVAAISGEIDFVFSDPTIALPLIKSGRLRMLATTGAKRSTFLPELPTVAEQGVPGFAVNVWFGVFAPRGTPQDIVQKVNGEFRRQLGDPQFAKQMLDIGLEVAPSTPQELGETLKRDVPRWREIVTEAGVKPD